MAKDIMDTMELDEIKQLLGEQTGKDAAPPPPPAPRPKSDLPAGEFDLDSIIAEMHSGPLSAPPSPPPVRPKGKVEEIAPHIEEKSKPMPKRRQEQEAPEPRHASKHPPKPHKKSGADEDFDITAQIELRRQQQGFAPRPAEKKQPVEPEPPQKPRESPPVQAVPQSSGRIREITDEVRKARMEKEEKASLERAEKERAARAKRAEKPQPQKMQEQPQAARKQEPSRVQPAQQAASAREGVTQRTGRFSKNEIGNIALLDREAPEEEAEQAEETVRNPKNAARSYARHAQSLRLRAIPVFLLFAAACYLSFAGRFGWPIPDAVSYTKSAYINLLALVAIEVVAMLFAVDIVGIGLYRLATLKPDILTLVSLSLTASLAHAIFVVVTPSAQEGYLTYIPVSLLTLFAAVRSQSSFYAGRQRVYKAATLTDKPAGIYCHEDPRDGVRRAAKAQMDDMIEFLRQIEKPDFYQKFSRIYAPLALAASVGFAAVSSFGQGEPARFLWALSAVLSVAAPLPLVCAFGGAYKNVSRRLLGEGAALSGLGPAYRLSRAKEAVLTDGDLFPAGTVGIEGLKVFGNYGGEKVLAYVAAVIGGSGSDIGKIFSETLRERYGRPVRASNILQYESGGMSAEIYSDSVLVGTASFLMRMGLRVDEGKYIKNGVFVAINSEIAGIFALKYTSSAQTYSALHTLRRLHIAPVLAVRDFNIVPPMVEKLFELPRGVCQFPEAGRRSELSDAEYVIGEEPCAILSRDGSGAYIECVHAAAKLSSAVVFNLITGLFAGVFGVFLMFFLTYVSAVVAAVPYNVLAYTVLWYAPVFLISNSAKKPY